MERVVGRAVVARDGAAEGIFRDDFRVDAAGGGGRNCGEI
jgi:hypothetical protein